MAQCGILSLRFKADLSIRRECESSSEGPSITDLFFCLSANASPLLGAGKTQRVPSSSDPGLPA